MSFSNVYSKGEFPAEFAVKEFDSENNLDDHSAFQETVDQKKFEESFAHLRALSSWRAASSLEKLKWSQLSGQLSG